MNSPRKWLSRELPLWIQDGIVDQQQATSILARYEIDNAPARGRLLVSVMGAVMMGLGVILLFAYNWEAMHRYTKLAVILLALLLSQGLALHAYRQGRKHLYESLFVLVVMLFGAGIWLVAQIYHLDAHYPHAFLLWGAAALLLAWSLPSLIQACLALGLLMIWHVAEVFDFDAPAQQALLWLLIGLFPLLWRFRSALFARVLASALLFSWSLITLTLHDEILIVSLAMLSGSMIFLAQLLRHHAADLATISAAMTAPAWLVITSLLFLLSFADVSAELAVTPLDSPFSPVYFVLPLVISQGLFLALVVKRAWYIPSLLLELSLLLLILPVLTGWDWVLLQFIGYNLMLLGLGIILVYRGIQSADWQRSLWGGLLVSALVFARYTDLFDSLLMRALAFLLLGAGLFIAGHLYHKRRQRSEP